MGRAFEVRKVAMAKTAAIKSKLYAKFGREIYLAAKSGAPDPESNQTLKRLIEKAKREQIPADVIKRNIEKAKGGTEDSFSSARYEGFGPGNSMLIVECLTDNVNRTYAEVRNCFTKTGGKLGVSGSALHQFNHQAVFTVPNMNEDEILEVLIGNDLDVTDIESDDEGVTLYAGADQFNAIRTVLYDTYPDLDMPTEEIMWLPIMETKLEDQEDFEKFGKLMQMLEELDDVQDVYHNVVTE